MGSRRDCDFVSGWGFVGEEEEGGGEVEIEIEEKGEGGGKGLGLVGMVEKR